MCAWAAPSRRAKVGARTNRWRHCAFVGTQRAVLLRGARAWWRSGEGSHPFGVWIRAPEVHRAYLVDLQGRGGAARRGASTEVHVLAILRIWHTD